MVRSSRGHGGVSFGLFTATATIHASERSGGIHRIEKRTERVVARRPQCLPRHNRPAGGFRGSFTDPIRSQARPLPGEESQIGSQVGGWVHHEEPSNPLYTREGDTAGQTSDVIAPFKGSIDPAGGNGISCAGYQGTTIPDRAVQSKHRQEKPAGARREVPVFAFVWQLAPAVTTLCRIEARGWICTNLGLPEGDRVASLRLPRLGRRQTNTTLSIDTFLGWRIRVRAN